MKKRSVINKLKFLFGNYKRTKEFTVRYYLKFSNGDEQLVETVIWNINKSNSKIYDNDYGLKQCFTLKEIEDKYSSIFLKNCSSILMNYRLKDYFYLDNSCYRTGKDIVSCYFEVSNLKGKKVSCEEYLGGILK